MTLNESMQIMAVLRAAYPNYYSKSSKEDLTCAVNLMAEIFAETDYELCSMAVRKIIASNTPFPPAIGELLAVCNEIKNAINLASVVKESVNEPVLSVRQYIFREASKEQQKMLGMLSKGREAIEDHS